MVSRGDSATNAVTCVMSRRCWSRRTRASQQEIGSALAVTGSNVLSSTDTTATRTLVSRRRTAPSGAWARR